MKKLLVLCFVLIANVGAAAPLVADAPERKQLIAMGYELQKEDAGDDFTIANAGSGRIVFSQNEDRLAVTRYFTRSRKLNSAQELELLRLINTFNDAYTYQISISEGVLQANIFVYGSYEP